MRSRAPLLIIAATATALALVSCSTISQITDEGTSGIFANYSDFETSAAQSGLSNTGWVESELTSARYTANSTGTIVIVTPDVDLSSCEVVADPPYSTAEDSWWPIEYGPSRSRIDGEGEDTRGEIRQCAGGWYTFSLNGSSYGYIPS